MPVKARCSARLGLVLLVGASVAALAGCSSLDGASTRIASIVTPYKIDVVQGNFVSREQVEALQPGMSRQQVREILGTPLVTSLFHADRWEYVFTLKRQGSEPQARKVTVFFANDAISRIEADELPSETEFVSTLRSKAVAGPLPPLTASEDALKKFPAPKRVDGAATPSPSSSNSGTAYPPLEPSGL